MNVCKKFLLANLAFVMLQTCHSFVPTHQTKQRLGHQPTSDIHALPSKEDNDVHIQEKQQRISSIRSKLADKTKPIALSFISLASVFSNVKPSFASAPVTPIRQFKPQDQKKIALDKMNEARNKVQMQEQMEHQLKCEEIEQSEGKAAREAYEKEYENKKILDAERRVIKRKELLYGLLQQGICPYMDLEGERQVYEFDHGIDLATVPTTPQQKEFMNLRRNPKLVQRRSKERFIIKCLVEDLIAKGEDPLIFFQDNKDKTIEIYGMSDKKIDAIATRYKQLLESQKTLSGIISETPFNIAAAIGVAPAKIHIAEASKADKAAKKAEDARVRALKKAEEKEAKANAKAEAQKLKAEQKAANAAAKAKAAQLKAEEEAAHEATKAEKDEANVVEENDREDNNISNVYDNTESQVPEDTSSQTEVHNAKSLPVVPTVSVVGVTGGAFVFKKMRDQNLSAEEERQKQFRLIMGLDDDEEDEQDEVNDIVDDFVEKSNIVSPTTKNTSSPPPPAISEPSKKRRMGLASVFAKKGSNRETDLNKLIAQDAETPELSVLLAKLLSFGAPGRFPLIKKLPGGMPMESFDLEKAKNMLIETRSSGTYSPEISAEAFACVVNCMIIDIVDLASSSLGEEKKNKMTVDALNVVMDFMDHAASLFDSVAGGVVITPVTYGGSLSKSKLEKMFTIYASSMMTSLDGGVTQDRIDTLQQVFNISDKRAEGLIQKGMMKNLMNMMKNPDAMEGMEGMEGLSDMMAAMAGGEGGMPGFDPNGEISPEDLKQSVAMMKELVDSGSVSKEELDVVKQQFSQMYGSDISELIKAADEGDADELGEDGKELLDLFKTILKED